ncbi:DNA-directed DNA polymerase [Sarracenia purpurea var. burkii]
MHVDAITYIPVFMRGSNELYNTLGLGADMSVGNRVGVVEPFLMRMAHGAPMRTSNRSMDSTKGLLGRFDRRVGMARHNLLSDEQILRVCKRFYVALILSRLVQEVPVAEVCEAFKVARGMVQALQENAGRFASMVSVFCERLGWHDLEGLVSKFQNRVSFGVRAEIVELTTIPFVKGSRARALYKAGMRTPQAIAEASISELVKALFESSSWAAQEDLAQRRIRLGVAKKIKNGARKIVLDKAEEARIAAFSAFKSLGLDVPQFSRPLSLKVAEDATRKEVTTSSGETTCSSVGVRHTNQTSFTSTVEGCENLHEVKLGTGQEKLAKSVIVDLRTSNEAKLTGISGINFDGENPAAVVESSTTAKYIGNADTPFPGLLRITGNEHGKFEEHRNHGEQEQNGGENTRFENKENATEKGPVSAVNIPGGIDSFLDLWDSTREFSFDIHFNKRSEVNSTVPFEIHGMAICWESSPVYYVNIPKDLFWLNKRRNDSLSMSISGDDSAILASESRFEIAKKRWNRIGMIMGKKAVRKFTWNLKVQIQVLKVPAISIQRLGNLNLAVKTLGLKLIDSSYHMLPSVYIQDGIDMCIVAWILWPDEEKSSNPNLEKEVKKRLSSEAAAAASRSGRWKNQMRMAAHDGCCRRAAQTRALSSVLWKLLVSEELLESLVSIEAPLVNILADMEFWGIGVDMEGCLRARHVLGRKLRYLEKEAYKLAGITFSLYTAADIANVIYVHLKLPMPEGYNKAKQHPSTDKHCLDLLR